MTTILVVENDKNHLFLIEQELLSEEYNIITAKDGCEALKKAKEYPPDLVVMDIVLPDMDGIELMSKILSEFRKVPVIINTAYSKYKDHFVSWAADAYITKSSDLSELKAMIKELILVFVNFQKPKNC